MPSIGRIVSSSMQTPATTMRAPRGALRIRSSSMPGTPTHSKSTAGRRSATSRHASIERTRVRVDDDVRAHALGQRAAARRVVGGDDRLDRPAA